MSTEETKVKKEIDKTDEQNSKTKEQWQYLQLLQSLFSPTAALQFSTPFEAFRPYSAEPGAQQEVNDAGYESDDSCPPIDQVDLGEVTKELKKINTKAEKRPDAPVMSPGPEDVGAGPKPTDDAYNVTATPSVYSAQQAKELPNWGKLQNDMDTGAVEFDFREKQDTTTDKNEKKKFKHKKA